MSDPQNEFVEDFDPTASKSVFHSRSDRGGFAVRKSRSLKRKHREARTMEHLAGGIVIAFFLLHFTAVIGLMLGWLQPDAYKEVIIALSGPLGLASAVTAFYYGNRRRRSRRERSRTELDKQSSSN